MAICQVWLMFSQKKHGSFDGMVLQLADGFLLGLVDALMLSLPESSFDGILLGFTKGFILGLAECFFDDNQLGLAG